MSLQFTIPRSVANTIDFPALGARTGGSIEYNDKDAGPSKTRITCDEPMAIALIEALKVHAGAAERAHDVDRLIDCAAAVKAAFDAIDVSHGIQRTPSKGFGAAS